VFSYPISSRIAIPAGAAFAPVRRALAAIDAVHGDGDLPRLPVVRTRATTEAGAYVWDERNGAALRFHFSGIGSHAELTVVHEIGHFLDHQGLGRPGTFASEAGSVRSLMAAIHRSAASLSLTALRQRRVVSLEIRGRRIRAPVNQRFVEYYLSPREQFARAYAQYIAVASQSPELLVQLETRHLSHPGLVYHLQWTDVDFEPIRQGLDRLLRSKRWMTS
jgi:hypothetical protein